MRAWLFTQVPSEGDAEFGYAFVRASDGEHVQRVLDLRCLTDANRTLFEDAAQRAEPVEGPYAPAEFVAKALDRLRLMLDGCERGEPPLSLSDWTREAPPPEGKIGPGWD